MRMHSTCDRPLSSRLFLEACVLLIASGPWACRPATPAVPSARPQAIDAAARAQPLRGPFAIIGDFGMDGPDEAAVARLVRSWQPQLVITTGDNNYPHGADGTFERNVAQHYAPFIAFGAGYHGPSRALGRPPEDQRFWPVLGNHDWHTAGARDYLGQFALPNNGRYYTVKRGDVEFFMVDSDRREPDGTDADSVQGHWLQAQLKASDAAIKLVVFHHPPYSVGAHGSAAWMRWPFAQWGAHAVFSGHNHNYERRLVDGIPYVVNGIGGARMHKLHGACALSGSDQEVCASGLFGAMRAHARPSGPPALELEGIDTNGQLFDRFTIPIGR